MDNFLNSPVVRGLKSLAIFAIAITCFITILLLVEKLTNYNTANILAITLISLFGLAMTTLFVVGMYNVIKEWWIQRQINKNIDDNISNLSSNL